jgi:hypothetical protein
MQNLLSDPPRRGGNPELEEMKVNPQHNLLSSFNMTDNLMLYNYSGKT